jgi:hypothetical protein
MAKKKKKAVHGTRRRRGKVGAIKEGSLTHYAMLALGAVAGGFAGAFGVQAANTALVSVIPSTPWLPPALVAGGGIGIAVIGGKHPAGLGFGLGVAAVAGTMAGNQIFNVPGIAGMSMTSNAPAGSQTISKSVGQGPKNYIDQTVGYMSRKHRAMGALGTN